MTTAKKTATAEDQLQINKFARIHKNYLEVKNELASANNEAQNINDAEDELLLLDDEDTKSIPVQIGSIFVHFDLEETTTNLEFAKEASKKRIAELEQKHNKLDDELKQLRAILYAKFGDNIHLEMDVGED